jgi:hypothetical protein
VERDQRVDVVLDVVAHVHEQKAAEKIETNGSGVEAVIPDVFRQSHVLKRDKHSGEERPVKPRQAEEQYGQLIAGVQGDFRIDALHDRVGVMPCVAPPEIDHVAKLHGAAEEKEQIVQPGGLERSPVAAFVPFGVAAGVDDPVEEEGEYGPARSKSW